MKLQDAEWSLPQPWQRPETAVDADRYFVATPATFDSGQGSVDYVVHAPDNYTPGYAYPLIVWFHDHGGDERDVLDWMPQLSPQNYLGLGLRGTLPVADGLPGERTWSTGQEHLQWTVEQIGVALMDLVSDWSIHSRRIVAAGIGRGATVALQMLLRRPDVFAGAACLNASLRPDWRVDGWGQYDGRNLWLGHSPYLADECRRPAIQQSRVLHASGLNVTPRLYNEEWPLDTLGREWDRWLMTTLCGDSVVV